MLSTVSKVFENSDIVVVNKPAGLIIHRKNKTDDQPALTDWVHENYPGSADVGEPFDASGHPLPRYGIVHRLDKDTSGLVVIAKNQPAFDYMKKQFHDRLIQKTYLALGYGAPAKASGIIDAPLGRIGLKRTTETRGKKLKDEKLAVTEYKAVKYFKKYTLFEVMPKTGRTHQIRVHLKAIGCPIAGDPVYAPKGWQKPKGLNRLFLHAFRLKFASPDGQSLTLEADLPEDLQNVLDGIE